MVLFGQKCIPTLRNIKICIYTEFGCNPLKKQANFNQSVCLSLDGYIIENCLICRDLINLYIKDWFMCFRCGAIFTLQRNLCAAAKNFHFIKFATA